MSTILIYGMADEEMELIHAWNEEKKHTIKHILDSEAFLAKESYEGVDIILTGDPNLKLGEEYFSMLEEVGIPYMVVRMTGYAQIDMDAATRHHVRIANVQNYSPNAITELAMALTLGFNRHMFGYGDKLSKGDFTREFPLFKEIRDCTVGVLGVGHIGSLTAKSFADMGARVLGFDAYPYEPNKEFMTYTDIDTIRREADIIELHLPSLPDYYHFINDEFLDGLKEDVIIVNTARGDLVDLAAINRAIKDNKIAAYGTDVLENEGRYLEKQVQDVDDEVFKEAVSLYPRVVILPHIGAWTERARRTMVEMSLDGIKTFLKDGTAKFWLNKEA